MQQRMRDNTSRLKRKTASVRRFVLRTDCCDHSCLQHSQAILQSFVADRATHLQPSINTIYRFTCISVVVITSCFTLAASAQTPFWQQPNGSIANSALVTTTANGKL